MPAVDLTALDGELSEEVAAGLRRVISHGDFVLGDDVGRFEEAFAAFQGTTHCVGVANGTDALELALRAVGGGGHDVIIPANTFVATAEAVVRAGGEIQLVDVDPESELMTAEAVAARLGPRTAAVVPVHLHGQMPTMEDLVSVATDAGVHIVEDAAQAHGATRHGVAAGSWGAAAGLSFYPTKNLGAFGDGGAVLTTHDEIARRVRRLRNHGADPSGVHRDVGTNSRLDSLQAVVLVAKLRRLRECNQARRRAALRYDSLLESLDGVERPMTLEGNVHVWHHYVVRVPRRDRVLRRLRDSGIGAAVHYSAPIHLHPSFSYLGHREGDFPASEGLCRSILSLPMFPTISERQQERVVETLASSLR